MWKGITPSLFSPGMLEIMYQLEIKIANKVLKQSTGNQLQEQLQELSGEVSYFFVRLSAYFDKLETSLQKYNIRDH